MARHSVVIRPAAEAVLTASQADRRRYTRARASGLVSIASLTWRRRIAVGATIDISQTGVRLMMPSHQAPAPGERLRVRVAMPAALGCAADECALTGTVMRTVVVRHQRAEVAIRFDALVDEAAAARRGAACRALALAAASVMIVGICWLKAYNVRWFWYDTPFKLYSLTVTVYVLTRVLFAALYREPRDVGHLPTVSVVIAAKNEEGHIAETVEHCFNSRYPMDRVEVLAIDDGSTDRTWDVLIELQTRYPTLRLFRFDQNLGKRHAMALGTQEAQGAVVVFVDSDGILEAEGMYRLVQPFADPTVGAVAGHALVALDPHNLISKMESSRYYISQRIMKAAESVFGSVTCCPGVFSAYRRSALLEVLPTWLAQRFLGRPTTFGDDRSLTNFILRRYRVLFHHGARCHTYVPERWRTFFRQQLRWKKSWARETLLASRQMHRKHPVAALGFYIGAMLTLLAPLVVLRSLIYGPAILHASPLPYLSGLALMYGLLCVLYFYFSQSWTWPYGLLFAALYVLVMCWQNYYAIVTINRTHWGTR